MFRSRFEKLGAAGAAAFVGVFLVASSVGAHQSHVGAHASLSLFTGVASEARKEADEDATQDATATAAELQQKEAAEKAAEQAKKAAELAAEQAAEANEDAADKQDEANDNASETGETGDNNDSGAKIMSGDETNDHKVGASTTTAASWKVQPK